MALTAGTYSIRSAMDTSICIGVAGLSTADGVKCQLESWTGAYDQVWDLSVVNSSYFKAVNGKSAKVWTLSPGLVPEKRVEQWAWDSGTAEQWTITDSGQTKTINGTSYPLYWIIGRGTLNDLCMDAAGEKSAPQTDVLIRAKATPAVSKQLWAFVPSNFPNDKLLAPTKGGLARTASGGAHDPLNVPSTVSAVYPSWVGSGSNWQCRYRTAVRGTSDAEVGAYGDWKCLANGSTANSGWGAPGTLCTVTKSGGRIRSSNPIAVTLGATNDKVRVQFQARRFESNSVDIGGTLFDGRGTAGSFTVDVNADVTVSVSTMTWTPGGLLITPVPSNGRDDNTYRIWVNGLSKKWQTFAGVANGDYCSLRNDLLKRTPVDGQAYTVQVKLVTIDKAEASASVSVTCSYTEGITLSHTPVKVAGCTYTVDLSSYPEHHVWVVTADDAWEMRDAADGKTWCACPQGVAFDIFMMAVDANGDWGTDHKSYAAQPVAGHRLVYEGGYFLFKTNLDAPPLLNVSGETNTEASLMTGGTFEAVTAGEGRMVGGSLNTLVLYSEKEVADVEAALEEAVFCWYEGLRGQLWRVAVQSVASTQQIGDLATLTISWRRTDA